MGSSLHPEGASDRPTRVPQVFARDVRLSPEAPLVFLDRGQADSLREHARVGNLVCPIAGCSDPRLVVRAGSRVRDHFAHRRSEKGGHAPETIAHHTSKHLIGRYLRLAFPDAEVVVDTEEVESGARPDVLIKLPNGSRVAYEVQFAALTAADWNLRHGRYQADGIKDIWIFGGSKHLRHVRREGAWADEYYVSDLMEVVLGTWHPPLFIDALAEAVAFGTGASVVALLAGKEPWRTYKPSLLLNWRPLADARWPSAVIQPEGLRSLMATAAADREKRRALEADIERARSRLNAGETAWADRRRVLEAERGPLPAVIDWHVDAWESTPWACSGSVVRQLAGWKGETSKWAPSEWRWRILTELASAKSRAVDWHRFVDDALGAGHCIPDELQARYFADLRRAGYVWFAGKSRPAENEGLLILAGDRDDPEPLVGAGLILFAGELYLSGNGRFLWQAADPVRASKFRLVSKTKRWDRGERCLPPDTPGDLLVSDGTGRSRPNRP